jgi:hypothetical protein
MAAEKISARRPVNGPDSTPRQVRAAPGLCVTFHNSWENL